MREFGIIPIMGPTLFLLMIRIDTRTIIYAFAAACLAAALPFGAFAAPNYFPIKESDGSAGLSRFAADWFSAVLKRMKEPSLLATTNSPNRQVYRLTIIPTWGNPVAFRAQRKENVFLLSSCRLSGEGGYDPGKLVESRDHALTQEDSIALDSLFTQLGFFDMPTEEVDVPGNDGEEWILEGVRDGRYHVIKRWSASTHQTDKRHLKPFLALCKFLADRSSLAEPPKNLGHKLLP